MPLNINCDTRVESIANNNNANIYKFLFWHNSTDLTYVYENPK